jgi:hypothetical protein
MSTGREGASSAETGAAVVLWVVVGTALVYGIGETVVRVTQLFS